MENFKLTQFSKAAGCGCKIGPEALEEILSTCGKSAPNMQLLLGNEGNEDAAAWLWNDKEVLLATTDFFMPMVDDAFAFGKIAAANAISDVFAKGGKPILALGILGWPIEKLPASEAAKVLAGAKEICNQHNIPLAGGHSVESPEPFFGLAVNGIVQRENLKSNDNLHVGDTLYLTKPLGLGISVTGQKRGLISEEELNEVIQWMSFTNHFGEKIAHLSEVHAMTDVTGFGLLGHLNEMNRTVQAEIQLNYAAIPVLASAKRLASQFVFPDITTRNFNAVKEHVSTLNGEQMLVLCDPQTSGGLLISASPSIESELIALAKQYRVDIAAIGKVGEAKTGRIEIL